MSFFSTLEADFKKLFGKSANYSHMALAAITYAAPFVEGVLTIVDPALVPVVQPIITRIETGLATAYSLSTQGASSAATLSTTLASVNADLSTLESVAGIKDVATQTKLATILSEVQAVIALIPASAPPPAA